MFHKDYGNKNQNYKKDKILKDKAIKKNGNHIRIKKQIKEIRNFHTLNNPHLVSFLLIYFIFIIKIRVSASLSPRNFNKLNEIQIKIIGTGEQNILNSEFSFKPSTILLNGNLVNIDSENKISNLENDINSITMKWDYRVNDCGLMFYDLTNLKEVDLSNFDGTEVKSMSYMFGDCIYLESVNFTNLKTPSLIEIGGLFSGCYSLLSTDLSCLDTSSVNNMASMFSDCTSLTSVNLSNLDTSKVSTMSYLFNSCTSLTSIDLSNLDTSSVKSIDYMLSECLSLTSLDLSKFNTDSLEVVFGLFSYCENLKYLDMSNFDVSKTTSLTFLFYGCQNLEYINFNNFIQGNQINEADMFFDEVPNNITYCINNKENMPLIMEELNKRNCTINDCSDDWNTKQKLEITEKNICVYDCSEDNKYKHQFKSKCYENCPDGTTLSSDNKLCLILYTEDKPFKYQEECVSDCKAIDFFNNECTINKKSTQAKETMIGIIENDIFKNLTDSLFENKKDLIVYDDTEIYQITSSFNQDNNEYSKNTTINLGECENQLKKENNINNDEALIIFKMEYYIDDFLIPITEYEIFNPETKEKLDLNVCNNIKINIKIPVKIDETIIYKYEPNSLYYKDKCFPNEECGDENTLIQRKNEFNNNHLSLCEKDCEFIKYDSNTKNVLCECKIKTQFTKLSDLLNNKSNLLFIITEPETDIFTNSYTESLSSKHTNINENTEVLSNKHTNINENTEDLSSKHTNINENTEDLSNIYTKINGNTKDL